MPTRIGFRSWALRAALLAGLIAGGAAVYGGALWALGFRPRDFVARVQRTALDAFGPLPGDGSKRKRRPWAALRWRTGELRRSA